MQVDYDVAMEVASHEAIIRQAYKDAGGVWTWSVGLTNATGHRVERYIDRPQPLQHCLNVYVWALRNYADQVRAVFAGHKLTKEQFAAALSYHWNTGAIRSAPWVTQFKAGKMAEAEKAFRASRVTIGGKPAPALSKRRAKEAELLFRGRWSHNGTMTEYTRLTPRSTPDWKSAKSINVQVEMIKAFTAPIPQLDQTPRPDNVPGAPTLTPERLSWIAAIIEAIKGLFSKG